jgi:hypothetical protein
MGTLCVICDLGKKLDIEEGSLVAADMRPPLCGDDNENQHAKNGSECCESLMMTGWRIGITLGSGLWLRTLRRGLLNHSRRSVDDVRRRVLRTRGSVDAAGLAGGALVPAMRLR